MPALKKVLFRWAPLLLLFASPGLLLPGVDAARADAAAELPDGPDTMVQQGSGGSCPDCSAAPAMQNPRSQTGTQPAAGSEEPRQTPTKEQQRKTAEQQLKQEEKQRILGVMPDFNMTEIRDAAPLTARQKFELDFHSSVDPFIFVTAGLVAGEEQAANTFPGYGQGVEGYAKRFGASYADTADGNLWGSGILPSLLHEDPRYFRRGSGPFLRRALYAASSNVWCKRDDGRWGPNYANVGGNFIAGGISNLYYPASERGAGLTVTRALTVTAEGGIATEVMEFWPDISRKIFHRKPRTKNGAVAQR